jgi:IS30 family transposase
MKQSIDEKAKLILAGFTGKQSRSQLKPHSDLIWKLYQRRCPFREIASILSEEYGMTVAPSTVFRFVVRLEQERSKPRRTRVRKEKTIPAVPTVPVVSEPNKIMPQPDDVRQRIATLKQQKTQAEPDAKAFTYDPDGPLHLETE